MRKTKKMLLAILVVLLAACALSACNQRTDAPAPSPTPMPTPTPEPPLPAGWLVTVDGVALPSGSVIKDGISYVKLNETMEALELEAQSDMSFIWRGSQVSLPLEGRELLYGEESFSLAAPLLLHREEVYVPVESLCQALDISLFYDEEYGRLYCTPGAGDWDMPEGYRVPVLMYHGVSDNTWTSPELFVSPSTMEEQIVYMLDNGYEPIWFEDLEHIDEYEKPVILSFDDGFACNYHELFPILQKYQVKASFFIITGNPDLVERNMTWDMIREMEQSGLASIQSHTLSHPYLNELSWEEQEYQLSQSRIDITRQVGKEPFVLCYPSGRTDSNTLELTSKYYRFGLKMSGRTFHTGDEPTLVWRYYVARSTSIWDFAWALDN